MEDTENQQFNAILDGGFKELVNTRPKKPISHFIDHILSQVSAEELEKHGDLREFQKTYQSQQE